MISVKFHVDLIKLYKISIRQPKHQYPKFKNFSNTCSKNIKLQNIHFGSILELIQKKSEFSMINLLRSDWISMMCKNCVNRIRYLLNFKFNFVESNEYYKMTHMGNIDSINRIEFGLYMIVQGWNMSYRSTCLSIDVICSQVN